MNSGHSVLAVANAFIRVAARKSYKRLTHMQLQKLAFFSQIFALGLLNRPMYYNHTEVWEPGPVIPELFHALKHHGHKPVTALIDTNDVVEKGSEEENLIRDIYSDCKGMSGLDMSVYTHAKDAPWRVAKEQGLPIITHEIMRAHFMDRMGDELAAAPNWPGMEEATGRGDARVA